LDENKKYQLFSFNHFGFWIGFFIVGMGLIRASAQILPAPATFIATPEDGAVTLQWPTPLAAATDYYLYRYMVTPTPTGTLTPVAPTATPTGTLTPVKPTPIVVIPADSTLGYQDVQVTNGLFYQYFLAGVNANGEGAPASVTVQPFSFPAPVTNVTVRNIHSDALDLSWGIPLSTFPITSYQIYRYTVPSTPAPTAVPAATVLAAASNPITTTTSPNYIDSAVTPNVNDYDYVVLALDNQNNLSGVPALSTNPAAPVTLPPVAPNLSAVLETTVTPTITPNGYGVRLIWNGPDISEGVSYYQVLRQNTPIVTIMVSPTPNPTYAFDDVTVPLGTSAAAGIEDYIVAAYNSNSVSTISNTVQEDIYSPSLQAPITVTPVPTTGVIVTWGQGSAGTFGLNGYWVFKSLNGLPMASGPTGTPTFTPTGTSTPPTSTPTAFASVLANPPNATPTYQIVDTTPSVNANGLSYWVVPYDGTGSSSYIGVATPSTLKLAPTPVSTVSVTGPSGNNEMSVTWSVASAGFYGPIVSYAIYRENLPTSQAVTPTPVRVVPVTRTSLNDFIANATPGTVYAYQVGAVDGLGNVSDLTTISGAVTTNDSSSGPVSAPATPVVLHVSGDGGSLNFRWLLNPFSDGVTCDAVYGSDFHTLVPTVTITPTPIATVLPSATPTPSITPASRVLSLSEPASPWQPSFYYVQAQNTVGPSSPATLSGISVPAYSVTAYMVPGTHQMQVYWNATPTISPTPPAVNDYGVYRSLTSGANFTPIATVPISTPVFTDTKLNPGVFYYYRITAQVSQVSQGSTVVAAESPLYPNYPASTPVPEGGSLTWPNIPGSFSASAGSTITTLSWYPNAAAEGVSSYAVFDVSSVTPTLVANVVATPIGTISPTPVFVFQANVSQGTISSYSIEAQNNQGIFSSMSQPVSVLSAPAITPTVGLTPPSVFSPTPGATPAIPQLVWISGLTYPSGVSGYNIYSSTSSSFPVSQNPVESVTSPNSFVSDSGIQGFVTNYWVVANNSGLGLSANPNAVGKTSLTMWPNPPSDLTLTANNSSVTLEWATPVGTVLATGYSIYRSTYAGATPTPYINSVPGSVSVTVDSQVTPYVGYYYSMTAQNEAGTCSGPATAGIIPLNPPTLQITPEAEKNVLVWSSIFTPTVTPSPGVLTGFTVYRAAITPNATPTYSEITVVEGISNTSYADTTVSDGVSYIYQVAASSGNGLLSNFSNAATQLVLPQPVSLTAVSGDGLVQLRWFYQGNPKVTYTLLRSLGTSPDMPQTIATGIVGVNYTDGNLLDKTFYTYQMVTVDPSGATTLSNSVNGLPAQPPIVNNQTVTFVQSGAGNTLKWYPANEVLPPSNPAPDFVTTTMYPLGGYIVNQSTDGGSIYDSSVTLDTNGTPLGSGGSFGQASTVTQLNYLDPVAIVGGNTYTYLIQAIDNPPDNPGMGHTTPYSLVTAYPVGASNALDRNSIDPVEPHGLPKGQLGLSGQAVHFRIAVSQPGQVIIRVYSLAGTFIRELVRQYFGVGIYNANNNSNLMWDGTNMNGSVVASGVYLITTEMPGHQEVDKIAVIK
jgi:fibronectin type 3 domain-containing protein